MSTNKNNIIQVSSCLECLLNFEFINSQEKIPIFHICKHVTCQDPSDMSCMQNSYGQNCFFWHISPEISQASVCLGDANKPHWVCWYATDLCSIVVLFEYPRLWNRKMCLCVNCICVENTPREQKVVKKKNSASIQYNWGLMDHVIKGAW